MASRNLPHTAGRDIAYCYSCQNEWYHPSGDATALQCPICQSDCIELMSQSDWSDARSFQQPAGPTFAAHPRAGARSGDTRPFDFNHPLLGFDADLPRPQRAREEPNDRRGSAYGDDDDDSDPGVADIEEQEFHDPGNYDMYRSTFTYPLGPSAHRSGHGGAASRRTDADSGPGASASAQRPRVTDPSDPASILSSFTNFITGYRDSFTSRSGGNSSNDNESHSRSRTTHTSGHTHRTTSMRFPGGTTAFTIATGPIPLPPRGRTGGGGNEGSNAAGGPFGDFDTFFSNIMADTAPPHLGGEHRNGNDADAADGLPPDLPAAMHHILLSLLHQPQGDVVHTNEAMDLVMSMLMDTNPGSGAAPPATQQALDQLDRKKVDADMLGPEGSAECTICIAEVNLGEEVLSLSCKHWFHEECALMWLNQHNTCPVCRRPVEASGSSSRGTRGERESHSNQGSRQAGNSGANNANSSRRASNANSSSSGANSANNTNNANSANSANSASNVQAGGTSAGAENTSPLNPNNYLVNGRFFMMNLSDLRNAAMAGATGASARAVSGGNGTATASSGQNSQPENDAGWPNILPPILRLRRPDAAAEQGQPWGQPWAWQTLWQQQQTDQHERARQLREQVQVERQQAEQQHRDRLDAIRRTAGLPPNHYRSSRTPERAAAAERERRRRDSHSPNPGLNFPSRRYHNGAVPPISEDYWSRSGTESQSSDSRQRSPSSVSTGHYYWHIGGLDGSGDEPSQWASRERRERFVDRYTRDRDRERQQERERSRPDRLDRSRISSILNTEPAHSSASADWSTSAHEHNPAPDEPSWAGLGTRLSSPGTQAQHHGGDESTDGNRGNSRSGSGSGGGGFFGSFLRGLSGGGNNHQSSNARGRS